MRRVVSRFSVTEVERIDRMAEQATDANAGTTVSRAAMLRAIVGHGLRAMESDPETMRHLAGAVVRRGRKRAAPRED
jgi:hypothetical protein